MKSKARYAVGMIVMPLLFPLCVVWAFLTNLWSALKGCVGDTAYDVWRDWESLCRLYKAGFKQFSNKERP
ncbi:MAG: hypothetical protein K0S02_563 [Achromobacter mucicolens]|jgi:hypothetical protein|nr:hypothetical protein [Achromobacter mucicolens]